MTSDGDDVRHHPLKGDFDAAAATWQRVTKKDGTPTVLELAFTESDLVAMRRADNPDGTVLIFTVDEWDAFTEGAKNGEFDFDVLSADAKSGTENGDATPPRLGSD